MKILLCSILFIMFLSVTVSATPKVQGGIFNQGSDLILKAKPDQNITTGFMSAAIVTIKYLTSYNINVINPVSSFGLQFYQTLTNGAYTYKIFQTTTGAQNYNWTANQEYEILRITVSGQVGTGNFEIANDQYITNNNGVWYIEHNVLGDITDYNNPLYHQNINGVPLPIKGNSNKTPSDYNLYQNFPNPFNPVTSICFDVPTKSFTKLIVYDILGKEVNVLIDDEMNPGTYKITWDGSNFSSGTYFYRFESGNFVSIKKLTLIK